MTKTRLSRSFHAWLLALALPWLVSGCLAEPGPQLSAPEALGRVTEGGLTLIDIRTPAEWRQTGVAPVAERIDMRQPGGPDGFAEAVLEAVGGDRAAPIALICRTGNRSGHMQQALLARGFTEVYNVTEGMAGSGAGPGWIRRGLPVAPCPRC